MNLTLRERAQETAQIEAKYGKKFLPLAARLLGEPERVTVQVGDRVRVNCGLWPGLGTVVEVDETGALVKRTIRGREVLVRYWAQNIKGE